jgi:hypothetical protein
MSKLIDKLIHNAETVSSPIGFRASRAAPSKPKMALIARIEATESTAPLADYAAGVDAVIMAPASTGKIAKNSLSSTVWGLWLEGKNVPQLKSYIQAGADFAILPLDSAFDLPDIEKAGKILLVESSLSEGLIRTINELPADAVLLADDEEAAPVITWHRLMLCQRLADLLAKPLLATVPVSIGRDGLQALWRAGVDGVVITVKAVKQAEKFKELRQIVDKTDFPARPRRRVAALLPHIAEEPGTTIADEEEEEEE